MEPEPERAEAREARRVASPRTASATARMTHNKQGSGTHARK